MANKWLILNGIICIGYQFLKLIYYVLDKNNVIYKLCINKLYIHIYIYIYIYIYKEKEKINFFGVISNVFQAVMTIIGCCTKNIYLGVLIWLPAKIGF